MNATDHDALARLRTILGSQARIARAFRLSPEQVSRIATGKCPVPDYMQIAVEFLETVPPQHWPERWRQ
jgi:lambda repressor-like predicted transcriptional regulator